MLNGFATITNIIKLVDFIEGKAPFTMSVSTPTFLRNEHLNISFTGTLVNDPNANAENGNWFLELMSVCAELEQNQPVQLSYIIPLGHEIEGNNAFSVTGQFELLRV